MASSTYIESLALNYNDKRADAQQQSVIIKSYASKSLIVLAVVVFVILFVALYLIALRSLLVDLRTIDLTHTVTCHTQTRCVSEYAEPSLLLKAVMRVVLN